jgi:ribosome maturation factor RimP
VRVQGRILGTGEGTVRLEQDGSEVSLEFGNIARARLVPDYDSLFEG